MCVWIYKQHNNNNNSIRLLLDIFDGKNQAMMCHNSNGVERYAMPDG